MKVTVLGSGAVGGYYGAKLVRAGHDVTFVARGAHLEAMRAGGLTIRGPLGDFQVTVKATGDSADLEPVDLVVYAVKTYSNAQALPLLVAAAGESAVVLTLQNGVDSVDEIQAALGKGRVLGGATYIAAALVGPGVVEQTGLHRRIVFGEPAPRAASVSARVRRLDAVLREADIASEAVANAWVPLWEKLCYLAPFAGATGCARVPIGPLWSDAETRDTMVAAFREVEALARAERVRLPTGAVSRIVRYVDSLHPTVRSSLLTDLQQGKPLEVEGLLGAVVRRARRRRLRVPIMSAFYAALKPHAAGSVVVPAQG
jgi:2-dehydropantoate 2-reductase